MKHPLHLESLITSEPYYHKQETDDYVLLYAKFPRFIFVDYLLVNSKNRGSGTGSKVIKALQRHRLPILLEVEKVSDDNPDTSSRRRFYSRHGFRHAKGLVYRRRDDSGQPFEMDILVWSPAAGAGGVAGAGMVAGAADVYRFMKDVCEKVHNHNALEFYEETPADPDKVLMLKG